MGMSPTAAKVVRIIELVSKYPSGLTLTEISGQLRYALSTVHDILSTLVSFDVLVIKNAKIKNYSIGPKLYIYGSTYVKSSNLVNFSKKLLGDLADDKGITSFIYKFNDSNVVIVYKHESLNAKIKTKAVGDLSKLHCSAAGKIFLTFDKEARELYDTMQLEKETEFTIIDKRILQKQLGEIKRTNIAYEFRETENHLISVACGVFDNKENTNLAGVIGVKLLYSEGYKLDIISEQLKKIASEISKKVQEVE